MAYREENLTLAGYIEMDEAFFGGRNRSKGQPPSKGQRKPPSHKKRQVLVLVESEGKQAGNLGRKGSSANPIEFGRTRTQRIGRIRQPVKNEAYQFSDHDLRTIIYALSVTHALRISDHDKLSKLGSDGSLTSLEAEKKAIKAASDVCRVEELLERIRQTRESRYCCGR
jgi:hypothetical protein